MGCNPIYLEYTKRVIISMKTKLNVLGDLIRKQTKKPSQILLSDYFSSIAVFLFCFKEDSTRFPGKYMLLHNANQQSHN